jgi:hypothetical protein
MVLAHKPVSQSGLARLALVVLVAGLAAAGRGGSDTAASGDQQVAAPQVEQDARYWQQLTNLFEPVELASMTDHRAYMLPSGYLLALHFDDMDLERAEISIGSRLGVPGRFCAKDQARVEAEFGHGFTHFHDLEADTHGGEPGAKGVWFVHSGVRDFESPRSEGPVTKGIDAGFMPTPAPACPSA